VDLQRAADWLVGADNKMQLGGFFDCAAAFLRSCCSTEIDVAVIELELPDACGIDCAGRAVATSPALKTVLVTPLRSPDLLLRAAQAGMASVLVKPLRFAQFVATLRFLNASATAVHPISAAYGQPGFRPTLRPCEQSVLHLFAQGLLYKEIEDRLQLTNSHLKRIQHQIFLKLGARNRIEAVLKWNQSTNLPEGVKK
jgi:DNA-binding NarL/FixJ family response regulator